MTIDQLFEQYGSKKFIVTLLIYAAVTYFGITKVMTGEMVRDVYIWLGIAYGITNVADKKSVTKLDDKLLVE